jgi:hypothetical protein
MKKINISKQLSLFLLLCLLVSCAKNKNSFVLEGKVKNAENKTLYLENIGTSTISLLDSVQLKGEGTFKFKKERPATPDFYRLRLGNQFINVVVDSIETINISADAENFAKDYQIEGSPESEKIKELVFLLLETSAEYNRLQKQYQANEISVDEYIEQANKVIESYKSVARNSIYSDPLSPVAYFALFQKINNLLIFDPYDKTDSKAFGAVANTWNQFHKGSPRSVQLYSLFTNSLAYFRGERPIEITEGNSKDLFEISLPSLRNKPIKLSDAGEDKLTLVDFTAYNGKESLFHNIRLAEVYDKYKSRGFEIYQISIDSDEHFWKNAAVNLPWICVWDSKSVYSTYLQKYNVSEIPTSYLRDKKGDVVAKIESYDNLEKEIIKYLK